MVNPMILSQLNINILIHKKKREREKRTTTFFFYFSSIHAMYFWSRKQDEKRNRRKTSTCSTTHMTHTYTYTCVTYICIVPSVTCIQNIYTYLRYILLCSFHALGLKDAVSAEDIAAMVAGGLPADKKLRRILL